MRFFSGFSRNSSAMLPMRCTSSASPVSQSVVMIRSRSARFVVLETAVEFGHYGLAKAGITDHHHGLQAVPQAAQKLLL
jgi:hypothetical protein